LKGRTIKQTGEDNRRRYKKMSHENVTYTTYRSAKVYVRNNFAGMLRETESGYEFKYHEEYLKREDALAVSLTLPLSHESYRSNVLFPFFDGLIPEGWMLDLAISNWKINTNDRFGILIRACNDCIGDVQIEVED